MSQILFIGDCPNPEYYDGVITKNDSNNIEDILKSKWLSLKDGWFLGPWKIKIEDMNLFKIVSPYIETLFKSLNKEYPDDVWYFYYKENNLEHPTMKELNQFIEDNAA